MEEKAVDEKEGVQRPEVVPDVVHDEIETFIGESLDWGWVKLLLFVVSVVVVYAFDTGTKVSEPLEFFLKVERK